MIVDAYCHCGISRYRPVEDVDAAMDRAQVDRAVLVQHLGEFDNTYLGAVVEARPDRFAAVGLIDHAQPDWHRALDAIAAGPIRGLRVTEQALSANLALCDRAVELGMVVLLDLPSGVGRWLAEVEHLANVGGEMPLVISHLGYPRLDGDRLAGGREILELADISAVHVHASGFGMWCDPPYAGPMQLAGEVIERFGGRRVMWGSNFPESADVESYRRELDVALRLPALAPPALAAAVGSGTALRVWFGEEGEW